MLARVHGQLGVVTGTVVADLFPHPYICFWDGREYLEGTGKKEEPAQPCCCHYPQLNLAPAQPSWSRAGVALESTYPQASWGQ